MSGTAPLPGGRGVRITGKDGSSADVEIRVDEITRLHELAFLDSNLLLENRAKLEATKRKWAWPNEPSPRDVVDRGGLRSSITGRPDSPTEWVHAVNVSYAAPVLLGYRRGTRNYPARNIYKDPLERFARSFETAFRRRTAADRGGPT